MKAKTMIDNKYVSARLATIKELRETTIAAFLTPVPSHETLRSWFEQARVPRLKANPLPFLTIDAMPKGSKYHTNSPFVFVLLFRAHASPEMRGREREVGSL